MSIFEQAARKKLRFASVQGLLSVEHLWDLPLTKPKTNDRAYLDEIAICLHGELKNATEVSFVTSSKKPNDAELQLKFDIVKHIIDVRVAENAAAATARTNAEKRQQLLELKARKESEKLGETSIEDLDKMIAALS